MIDIKIMKFTRQEIEDSIIYILSRLCHLAWIDKETKLLNILMFSSGNAGTRIERSSDFLKEVLQKRYNIVFQFIDLPVFVAEECNVQDLINFIADELERRGDLVKEIENVEIEKKTFWENIDLE